MFVIEIRNYSNNPEMPDFCIWFNGVNKATGMNTREAEMFIRGAELALQAAGVQYRVEGRFTLDVE